MSVQKFKYFGFLLLVNLMILEISAQEALRVNFSINLNWRLSGPSFAYEIYPLTNDPAPFIFDGAMVPRGQIVLSCIGAETDQSQEVKSRNVSITHVVEIAGAHHWDLEGNSKWLEADELPPLQVFYEPKMPDKISFPGPHNCVLLFEIGEKKQDEWAEGSWSVMLRLNASKLNWRLEPYGLDSQYDPAFPEGTAALHKIDFKVKKLTTDADFHNLFYFEYLEATMDDEPGSMTNRALPKLNALLEVYPNDGFLLYARAQYYMGVDSFDLAIADGKKVMALYKQEKLTRMFELSMPVENPEEVSELLEFEVMAWEQVKEQEEEKKKQSND